MYSRKDLAECAHRELQKRIENYPRWVNERKMTRSTADDQIAKMRAIYRLLVALSDQEIHGGQGGA